METGTKQNDDLIGGMKSANEQQSEVKNSILSLYNAQSGYTAQGYQVGSMYHQQQMTTPEMYRQQQLQYQQWQQQQMKSQVDDVQRQMARLRVNQQHSQQQQQGTSTLNPQLW